MVCIYLKNYNLRKNKNKQIKKKEDGSTVLSRFVIKLGKRHSIIRNPNIEELTKKIRHKYENDLFLLWNKLYIVYKN